MTRQAALRMMTHLKHKPKGTRKGARAGERIPQDGGEQASCTTREQRGRARQFRPVRGVRQIVVDGANRKSFDLDPQGFDSQNLAADKTVADFWVLIRQIREFHDGCPLSPGRAGGGQEN